MLYVSEFTFPNSYPSEIAMLSFHIRNEIDLFQELVLTDVTSAHSPDNFQEEEK